MFYATQNFFEKLTFALPPPVESWCHILSLGDTTENPLGIRLAPVLAGVLAILGIALWHRYRLPDNVNRETVAAAGSAQVVRSRAWAGHGDIVRSHQPVSCAASASASVTGSWQA